MFDVMNFPTQTWWESWQEHEILDALMDTEMYEFEVARHYLGPNDDRVWNHYYGGWLG